MCDRSSPALFTIKHTKCIAPLVVVRIPVLVYCLRKLHGDRFLGMLFNLKLNNKHTFTAHSCVVQGPNHVGYLLYVGFKEFQVSRKPRSLRTAATPTIRAKRLISILNLTIQASGTRLVATPGMENGQNSSIFAMQ